MTTRTAHPTAGAEDRRMHRPVPGADLLAAGGAAALVALAVAVAPLLGRLGCPVHADAAPLFGRWLPHVGPGTPAALLTAALTVRYGPALAAVLPWRRLLLSGYAAAVAWILSLALVDGWQRGLAGRLTTRSEYLSEVGGVHSVPAMLRGFTGRILAFQPDSWVTHVSGHPPGALLVFVALDRVGLGGGGWAALSCVLTGALVAVAVPVTVRALGGEAAARAAVPFLVLFPGAVWIGASADGLFTGVTASGVALLAVGLVHRGARGGVSALFGGALLAFGCYLSYGLVLMAVLALVVVVAARAGVARAVRSPAWAVRSLVCAAVGAAVVAVGFSAAGFWWPDGYRLVEQRYYQGLASQRPYGYWVWADIAALMISAGPVAAVVLRRATTAAVRRRPPAAVAACLLPLGAAAMVLTADLSGLSKAEVERIWLPFAVWLTAGVALLPPAGRRAWLTLQATVALTVNHLVLTVW